MPGVANVAKEKVPQLNEPMATTQPSTTIYAQLMTVGQQCGLRANEFAVVEESVLLDGAELLDREANICQVLDPFTKLYVGVTVVLPRDLPFQQESKPEETDHSCRWLLLRSKRV